MPGRTTLPEIEKIAVPGELSTPIFVNSSGPSSMIAGTVAIVHTLLICVGALKSPCTGGNGGLGRGWPRRPSSESRSAVSSPQM